MSDAWQTVTSVTMLAVVILGGLVRFLWNRINDVQAQQTIINAGLREEMSKFTGETRNAIQIQGSEHRTAIKEIWEEFRRFAEKSSEQHISQAEHIGKLPTRDDVEKIRVEWNSNISAMEGRIMGSLRKEIPNR